MIRRHLFALKVGLIAADAAVATLLALLVGAIRWADGTWATMWHAFGLDILSGALLYGLITVTVLWLMGLYRLRARWSVRRELEDVGVASVLIAAATMSFVFLAKIDVSRLYLVTLFLAQPVVLTIERLVLREAFGELRRRGYNQRFVLVVGTGEPAAAFTDRLRAHPEMGLRVVGFLALPDAAPPDAGAGVNAASLPAPLLGTTDDLVRVFHERVVDEIAVCLPSGHPELVEAIVRLGADEGKTVRVPSLLPPVALPDPRAEEFDGVLVRSYVHAPGRPLALALKRAVDIAGATVGLVLLSPLLLGVAVVIRVREGGPVLFRQERVGLHGRAFTILKFRTMVPDAEARYAEVVALSDTRGAAFKMTNDPRITRLGAVLRKTSIDELPQLLNVLRGEMSLVGPRPAPPREVDAYDIWHRRRLSMKPGISGLWQVEARRDEDFDHRAELDMRYIDNWSLLLDAKLIVRTIPALVQGR